MTNTLEQEHAALHAGSAAQVESAPEPVPLNDILQEPTQEHTPETVSALDNSRAEPTSQVNTEKQPATQASVDQSRTQEESESSPSSSTEETLTTQDQEEPTAEAETQEGDKTGEQEETTEHETSTGRSHHRRRRSSNA